MEDIPSSDNPIHSNNLTQKRRLDHGQNLTNAVGLGPVL
jgi:hypothetical protein